MTTKQPTTLDRVIVMQKLFADLYKNSWVISIHSEDVLIREGYLAEVAPLTDWALNTLRNDPIFPYEHAQAAAEAVVREREHRVRDRGVRVASDQRDGPERR